MYYVDFKPNGSIAAFYSDERHGDNIPDTALPITEEQWLLYSSEGGRLYRRDDVGDEPARLKTPNEIQQDLEEDIANTPPNPKTPEQLRIEELEAQLSVQNENNAAFMDFVLQTLGV